LCGFKYFACMKPYARPRLSQKMIANIVVVVLVVTVAFTERRAERYGDNLQIALPLLAAGCAHLNGQGGEFWLRYVVGFSVTHGFKRGLGDIELNTRPHGGPHGFPSGHSAAAAFGATWLIQNCIMNNILVKTGVIVAAGFVGGSRIEAGAHDVWQVLVGWMFGIGYAMAFRAPSRGRRAIALVLRSIGRAIRLPVNTLWNMIQAKPRRVENEDQV